MSQSSDDHKRARFQGEAFAAAHLAGLVRNGLPHGIVESYAAGVVDAVRAYLTAYVSDKAAHDVLQAAADRAGAPRATGSSVEPEGT